MKPTKKKDSDMTNTYKEKETALKVSDLINLAENGCEFRVVNNPIKDGSWIEAWKNGHFAGASKTLKNAYKIYDKLKKVSNN